MNFKTFQKIIKLNKDFYERVGDKFSKTRQLPWQGWEKVLDVIKTRSAEKIDILDLGCGNARLYKYLHDSIPNQVNYTGLDFSLLLLKEAQNLYEGVKFHEHDVISELSTINEYYDVIVAFGLTHHIPSQKYRRKWFSEASNFVKKNGLFIYTIWDFTKDKRFQNAKTSIKTDKFEIRQKELEAGDYFLGWQNMKDVYRYFHEYSDKELDSISTLMKNTGMELIEEYKSDGRSQDLNHYFIWRKFS